MFYYMLNASGAWSLVRTVGHRSMSTSGKVIIGACLAGLVFAVACGSQFLRHISGPRVVARAVSPDGVEMCIVQQCNWDAEPFTTSFVYRKPGTGWGRFYFDHQDWYWGKSPVLLDTNKHTAVFYRAGCPAVTFEWATETYTLHRWNRTLTGAQDRLPMGWSPQMSVYSQ